MADPTAFFVQFPHPGREPPPTGDRPWNTGENHRRKFLVARGRYVDGGDRPDEAELTLWGEWEPPSQIVERWPSDGHKPRALHRPYWVEPIATGVRQNTDPWVFGEQMIYSNCKQLGPRPRRRPNSMQRLTRGSVICFGSKLGGEFCIDTVFVIASAESWVAEEVASLHVDDAFKTCVGDSLATDPETAGTSLTLYRGATFENPVERMFSFSPARRADGGDRRFARPVVESEKLIGRFINPLSSQSVRGSKDRWHTGTVREAWDELRAQTLRARCLLAVRLQTPERERGRVEVGRATDGRC